MLHFNSSKSLRSELFSGFIWWRPVRGITPFRKLTSDPGAASFFLDHVATWSPGFVINYTWDSLSPSFFPYISNKHVRLHLPRQLQMRHISSNSVNIMFNQIICILPEDFFTINQSVNLALLWCQWHAQCFLKFTLRRARHHHVRRYASITWEFSFFIMCLQVLSDDQWLLTS